MAGCGLISINGKSLVGVRGLISRSGNDIFFHRTSPRPLKNFEIDVGYAPEVTVEHAGLLSTVTISGNGNTIVAQMTYESAEELASQFSKVDTRYKVNKDIKPKSKETPKPKPKRNLKQEALGIFLLVVTFALLNQCAGG